MKTLYLVRHAKAALPKTKVPDFQRNLVKSGEKTSLSMAKKLRKLGVSPDLLMSSTANRALETAHLFAKGLNYPVEKILVQDALYNEMSTEALLYIIKQVDDSHGSLMLFGHNPAFTQLAAHLVRNFTEDIPKTGIVGIEFNETNWKDIHKGSGSLRIFEYPKKLTKTYKQLQKDLETTINQRIVEVLNKIDDKTAVKQKKLIRQTTTQLVDNFLKNLKANHSKEEQRALAEKRKILDKTPGVAVSAKTSAAKQTESGLKPSPKPRKTAGITPKPALAKKASAKTSAPRKTTSKKAPTDKRATSIASTNKKA